MTADSPRVLVIEDDRSIRKFLRISLTSNGFDVIEAETAEVALRQAIAEPPDAIILDLGLPDADGLDVIYRIRDWTTIPIIVLSARGSESDKVKALDSGADDYLTKPFGTGELLARIRVALRHHSGRTAEDEPVFRSGHLIVDLAHRLVTVNGREVHLTPTEYRLLTVLVRHAGKVVTHRQLLKDVWGPDAVHENQYLRVYMGTLRSKIEERPAQPSYLLTEAGVGYRLVERSVADSQ
ncbi:MAG: response regulator [Planctomyces sp.]|jgi:two-component system KDP operon response regulator KdpE